MIKMMAMLKKLLFISIALVGYSVSASTYFVGQGGYQKVYQKETENLNVYPVGMIYGGGIGFRESFFDFEALILKSTSKADIKHDGASNQLVHSQSSVILALNFYLKKEFYVRAGYGFHSIDQEFSKTMSAASLEDAKTIYDLQEDTQTEGFMFGGGFLIYNGKKLDSFIQAERYDFSTYNAGAWNVSFGIKYHLN